jgi:hypothetical protein
MSATYLKSGVMARRDYILLAVEQWGNPRRRCGYIGEAKKGRPRFAWFGLAILIPTAGTIGGSILLELSLQKENYIEQTWEF